MTIIGTIRLNISLKAGPLYSPMQNWKLFDGASQMLLQVSKQSAF